MLHYHLGLRHTNPHPHGRADTIPCRVDRTVSPCRAPRADPPRHASPLRGQLCCCHVVFKIKRVECRNTEIGVGACRAGSSVSTPAAAAHHYYKIGLLSRLGKTFCPGWERPFIPVSQPGPPRRDKTPFVPGQATRTNEGHQRSLFSVSFPISFGLFLFHFRLNFVLEFKWSMNCSNINIYSFTHIKCNTKVSYIQSATQKSITYKVQLKFYLILSYLLLLSMFDTPS
jgi:hypothetical protein